MMNYPVLVFLAAFVIMWLSSRLGAYLHRRFPPPEGEVREDFGVVLAASLTLLGLIIGFTFSMAVNRYDQRKLDEEAEANAIGTEYVRADLLQADDAAKVRGLLKAYLGKRILFYDVPRGQELETDNDAVAQLQNQLWSVVQAAGNTQPTPVIALAVSGMNDVLNSQGYAQAAWWNRIPIAAWGLMSLIAIFCNLLIGYGLRQTRKEYVLLIVLPLLVAISFLLIADIDSPRGGIIRVHPRNLNALDRSLPK